MATPMTNPEPIPGFDAVADSRKWREASSRKLEAMSRDERLAYLAEARERYLAEREGKSAVAPSEVIEDAACIVRENPPTA
jgi:hypothetical protein